LAVKAENKSEKILLKKRKRIDWKLDSEGLIIALRGAV
jgi:hypothetical protein